MLKPSPLIQRRELSSESDVWPSREQCVYFACQNKCLNYFCIGLCCHLYFCVSLQKPKQRQQKPCYQAVGTTTILVLNWEDLHF